MIYIYILRNIILHVTLSIMRNDLVYVLLKGFDIGIHLTLWLPYANTLISISEGMCSSQYLTTIIFITTEHTWESNLVQQTRVQPICISIGKLSKVFVFIFGYVDLQNTLLIGVDIVSDYVPCSSTVPIACHWSILPSIFVLCCRLFLSDVCVLVSCDSYT